ncbi:MAG: hypothetical protein HY271_05135 [Deltaproteobacteria bacterium]|nr:hypothetical protein [Deltaproteobacteria bacterium]
MWTELQLELQSGEGASASHPSKELLLSYEEHRAALQPVQLRSIEEHLACCHACADELRALRGFDFSALRRPAAQQRARSWNFTRELPSWLRAVVWHPAFAYALVLVLLYPALLMQLRRTAPLVAQPALREAQPPELANREPRPIRGADDHPTRAANKAPPPSEEDSRLAATRTQPRAAEHPLEQSGGLARTGGGTPRTTGSRAASVPAGAPPMAVAEPPVLTREMALEKSLPTGPAADVDAMAKKSSVADGSENGSADTQEEMEASGALDGPTHTDGDSGEPHVLGFADTEEPREDADVRRARPPAIGSTISGLRKAGPDELWRAIVLAPDRTPEVQLSDLASGVSLRLPPSALPPAAQGVEVQVVGPGGKDAARETFRSASAEPVEIRMRTDELATGTYRVQVRGSEAGTPSDQISEFLFVVR